MRASSTEARLRPDIQSTRAQFVLEISSSQSKAKSWMATIFCNKHSKTARLQQSWSETGCRQSNGGERRPAHGKPHYLRSTTLLKPCSFWPEPCEKRGRAHSSR